MKEILWSTLRAGREVLLWKLEGLGEYDLRRPLTPTGTNLLGLVKHVASEEYGYFGDTFGRPAPEQLACAVDGSIWQGGDMWATPDESTDYITAFYRRACAWADETIGSLELDTPGSVPWWNEGAQDTTLGAILVRMISEHERHAGHADITRELIDGAAGSARDDALQANGTDAAWWRDYVARIETAARAAAAQAQRG